MLNDLDITPNDPAELRAVNRLPADEVKSQALLIENLKHQLAGQKRYRFGVRSESMDQLNLTFEDDEEIAEAADEQAKSARRARRAAPIAIKADLRWSGSVATRAAAQDLWQVSTGPGHPLHFWPDAEGAAILEPRPFGTRQQYSRTRGQTRGNRTGRTGCSLVPKAVARQWPSPSP